MKPGHPAFTAAFVGALVTLFITVVPFVQFAYRAPVHHIVLDTAAAMVGLLVAFLLLGRFGQRRALSDIVLVFAMLIFAIANLGLSALPTTDIQGGGPRGFAVWAPLVARFVGSLAFAVAPYLRREQISVDKAVVVLIATVAMTVLTITTAVQVFASALPEVLDPQLSPESAPRPRVVGSTTALLLHLASMVAFAVGAMGCLRRERETGDEFMAWCAAGGILAAFSRLNFFLFPSLVTAWFYTGDLLRLGFYLMLLVGAAREIQSYWTTSAVDSERRRIARDLHDGLAQELAFILGQTRLLAKSEAVARPQLNMVAGAAQRALDESRRAIALLATTGDEPIGDVVARTAEDVAHREGVRVRLHLEAGISVSAEIREVLVRILREAVTNACRHGGATLVDVTLREDRGIILEVADDGSGFDAEAGAGEAGGFGLISMRERAQGVGGRFSITSAAGSGTKVEVWLPSSTARES